MFVVLKFCIIMCLVFQGSTLTVEDLANLTEFDVMRPERTQELFYATVQRELIGDADVCEIFRNFLQNNLDKETFEKNSDWLIKMFDSWGKIPSGIMDGNTNDMGQFDECLEVEGKQQEVTGKYCHQGVSLHGTISIGVCIPSKCALPPKDSTSMIWMNSDDCQTKDTYTKLSTGDIIVISIFGTILVLMILSTVYDCFLHYSQKEAKSQLFIAFSVLTNGKKLFTTSSSSKSSGQIACLNGIRTISLMWIIAGHTFSVQVLYPKVNFLPAMSFIADKRSAYLHGAHYAVDTFFFLSGFLLSFNYLKNVHAQKAKAEKSAQKPQNPLTLSKIPMFYVHRILRIMPPLAAVYAIGTTIILHITTGPISPGLSTQSSGCYDYWWSFFLFIQNYVNWDQICLPVTWYLSADMQMFILSPLVIIPVGEMILRGKKRFAYIFTCAVVLLSIICPMIKDLVEDQDANQTNTYATHPHISVYTIGLLFGMVVIDCCDKKIQINHVLNVVLWVFSLGGMLAIVITNHDTVVNPTQTKNALFFAFTRPAWAAALAWIVFTCHFGYGGPVNWLLSKSIHQIMTRLSFSMYLLHSLVQGTYLGHARTPMHFSEYEVIYLWCGDYIFTIVVSILCVLAFESPVVVLEKVIFGTGRKVEPKSATLTKTDTQQA